MNVPNQRSADEEAVLESREHYLKSHELALIKYFFTDIEFYKHDDFFRDDQSTISDEGLIKTMTSVSYDWATSSDLEKCIKVKFVEFVNISEK